MVEGSGLETLCSVGDDFDAIKARIEEYLLLDYSEAYFTKRKETLLLKFSNTSGAKKLIENISFTNKDNASRRTDHKLKGGLSQLSSFMSYFSL